jgi:hypothetical protein
MSKVIETNLKYIDAHAPEIQSKFGTDFPKYKKAR